MLRIMKGGESFADCTHITINAKPSPAEAPGLQLVSPWNSWDLQCLTAFPKPLVFQSSTEMEPLSCRHAVPLHYLHTTKTRSSKGLQ